MYSINQPIASLLHHSETFTGVEPEVVPVKNVDGNGFYIDDKSDFHYAVDEAVAAHRHDVVRNGRVASIV